MPKSILQVYWNGKSIIRKRLCYPFLKEGTWGCLSSLKAQVSSLLYHMCLQKLVQVLLENWIRGLRDKPKTRRRKFSSLTQTLWNHIPKKRKNEKNFLLRVINEKAFLTLPCAAEAAYDLTFSRKSRGKSFLHQTEDLMRSLEKDEGWRMTAREKIFP